LSRPRPSEGAGLSDEFSAGGWLHGLLSSTRYAPETHTP